MKTVIHNSETTFVISNSIAEISDHWDRINDCSIFLKSHFLKLLEEFRPAKLQFKYALAYQKDELLAAFYFQILPFNAADRLKVKNSPANGLSHCFYNQVKRLVASKIDFKTLVCGNLLATGPYGIKSVPGINSLQLQKLLDQLLSALFEEDELIHQASVFLMKELPVKESFITDQSLSRNRLHPFFVQPSMYFQLDPRWKNFEDYLDELQSKYRLRLKKALEAFEGLEHRELDQRDVEVYQKTIFELYQKTADNSEFNLVELNENYFQGLKLRLGQNFRIFGFFKENSLVGFYSYLDDKETMVGHFLGTIPEENQQHQLYLNMLIQFIKLGIESRYKLINLARTALEIKSSVGAIPVDMVCYIKHRNKIYNSLVPNLINYLKPEKEFVLRSPYKKKNGQASLKVTS